MARQLAPAEVGDTPMVWPVASHVVLGHGKVSDFVNDSVLTPDGGRMERQYTLHPGAVGVIAWDDADRIAVVRQYRHPVGFQLTEPPAGLLDAEGETWLSAAQRELAEEAGLFHLERHPLKPAGQVRTARLEAEGWHDEVLHVFNLTLSGEFVPSNQDGEVAEFMCLSAAETLARIDAGAFTVDATQTLVQGLRALKRG